MNRAKTKTGAFINADSASRADGPFFCSQCGQPMYLVHRKTRYFQHYYAGNCITSASSMLEAIQQAILKLPLVSMVEIGRQIQGMKTGLSFALRGAYLIMIEDASLFTVEEIYQRTLLYSKHKPNPIYTLWTAPLHTFSDTLTQWELYLHGLYYGHILYWKHEASFQSVHFVSEQEGGWPRTVEIEDLLALTALRPQWRAEFQTPMFNYPTCALLMRRYKSKNKEHVLTFTQEA